MMAYAKGLALPPLTEAERQKYALDPAPADKASRKRTVSSAP